MRKFNLVAIDSKEVVLEASKDLKKLSDLIHARKEYYSATDEYLKEWLINGSLILTRCGDFAIFKSSSEKEYPEVIEMSSEEYGKGVMIQGGEVSYLPSAFAPCPSCKKGFTIEDVYNHNFKLVEDKVVHTGECAKNYYYIATSLNITKHLLLGAKRALGDIKNIVIKQKNDEDDDFIKINFEAYNYNFEVNINSYSMITVVCKNDKTSMKLYQVLFCTCCYESIEKALKSWKEEYVG